MIYIFIICLYIFISSFTWNGKNLQYPIIRSIRYPRYNTPNPNVTVFVVNLNVLKLISLIELILPNHLVGEFYVGNMLWISNNELTLTYTSRDQTLSSTILCTAPKFVCTEVSAFLLHFFLFYLSFISIFVLLILYHYAILLPSEQKIFVMEKIT